MHYTAGQPALQQQSCITRQKTPSPLLNRIEQCFAAHVVHTCQQY
jgi:hypothetical protein